MDASPGEPTDPQDHLLLEVAGQADRLGWGLVTALRRLRFTRWDAEIFLLKLDLLTCWHAQQRESRDHG